MSDISSVGTATQSKNCFSFQNIGTAFGGRIGRLTSGLRFSQNKNPKPVAKVKQTPMPANGAALQKHTSSTGAETKLSGSSIREHSPVATERSSKASGTKKNRQGEVAWSPSDTTTRIVKKHGVRLEAKPGAVATILGKKVNVDVQVHAGTLADLPFESYTADSYDGDNVVEAGSNGTRVSESHLGTNSMAPCHPAIVVLMDKKSGKLSISLTHCFSKSDTHVISKIKDYRKQGFKVQKIISGLHQGAFKDHGSGQEQTMKGLKHYAAKNRIEFGVVQYDDRGKGAWWISASVVNDQTIKIDIGSDNGLS